LNSTLFLQFVCKIQIDPYFLFDAIKSFIFKNIQIKLFLLD